MMRRARCLEAALDDDLGLGEAGVEIAVVPLLRRLAQRHLALVEAGEVLGGPFHRLQRQFDVGDVAAGERIDAARIERIERIDDVVELLEIDLDGLDRRGSDFLGFGRDCHNRSAGINRLAIEDRVDRRWKLRHVVGGDDGDDALYLQGRRGVDVAHPRMRHG